MKRNLETVKIFFNALLKSKYNQDIFWNIGSFGLCGIIGVFLNVIIINTFNSAALGYFNQIYAIYVFFSQVCTWGLHLSLQKYIPQYKENASTLKRLLTSAFLSTFFWSVGIAVLLLTFNRIPGYIFHSINISRGFIYVVPGLVFFSLNKILLSYANGLRMMKMFASFNALRFVLMLVVLLVIIFRHFDILFLSFVFSIPEILLFFILFSYLHKHFSLQLNKTLFRLIFFHFRFANKAALGHIVLDINSKADVIIISIFLSDSQVGIYSFAAYIIDGFLQIVYVFRTNLNPIITSTFYSNGIRALESIIRTNVKNNYKIFSIFGGLILIAYPIFLHIFKVNEAFGLNYLIFSILTFGCLLSSGYLPFQMILNQTGFPQYQTYFLVLYFITNVLLNVIFVPLMGIVGSAIATSLALILQVIYLRRMTFKIVKVRI